jgi:Protein of unknown function (DUF2924)
MIAPAKRALAKQAAELDLAASVAAETPKADEVIKSKKPRLRGRARAQIAQVIEGPSSMKPVGLSPGTRITRTYKGVKHVVIVHEDGRFEWKNQFWKSLSSVAKAISGQHCSGPAFFGLRTKKEKKS